MRRLLIALVAIALVGGGACYWFKLRARDEGPKIIATATIERGAVRKTLEATGIIKAQVGAIVRIGARATGRIDQMLVKVGDKVKRGDLIAVIDDRELKAQRAEAEAKLAQAKAELERVRTVYPLQIREAVAELDVAQAQAQYARSFYDRQRRIFEQGLIARDTMEDAMQKADVAKSQVASREAAQARIKAEFARQLERAQKAVVEIESSIQSLDVRLSYARIYSPIAGVVSQVTQQEGETVVTGLQVANLITVLDPSRLEMWIYVDETDVGQTTPGMPVEFRVDSYPDKTFKGRIDQIYPQPEIRDNIVYYQALVRLDENESELLRPEMTTQARIIVASKDDVLALPNEALKWVGDRQLVFKRMEDDRFQGVTPKLGLVGLTHSEIQEGLAQGDVVATQLVLSGQQARPAMQQPSGGEGQGGPRARGGSGGSGGSGGKKGG